MSESEEKVKNLPATPVSTPNSESLLVEEDPSIPAEEASVSSVVPTEEMAKADEKHWEDFFSEVPPPSDYECAMQKVTTFVSEAKSKDTRVVLVSSGGTTVPLEQLTVRFVDNFSSGTRGAVSTEVFLDKEYLVIFLYRQKSLKPYARHMPSVLDLLELDGTSSVKIKPSELTRTRNVLEKYVKYKSSYLMVAYETLGDYLWLLKGISSELNGLGPKAMLYLAAAVSDFYIPKREMPEHKMQSDTKPGISFSLVPKMLRPLTNKWAPNAYIVSFKLETDVELLLPKAKKALERYHHHMVIANLLTTRKKWVTLVERNGTVTQIENPNEDHEIEEYIIETLVGKHSEYIETTLSDLKPCVCKCNA